MRRFLTRRCLALNSKPFLKAACLALALALTGCGGGGSNSGASTGSTSGTGTPGPATAVFANSAQVLKPYTWVSYPAADDTEAGFSSMLANANPLQVTFLLLNSWIRHHDAAAMSSRIDQVIAKWRLWDSDGGLTYASAYRDLPAGWRSGMSS